MKILKSSIFCLLFCVLCSCSSSIDTPKVDQNSINTVELFMSRKNLNETEFEHFKLFDNNLFLECGKIHHGRHVIRRQEILAADDSQVASVKGHTAKLVGIFQSADPMFEERGTNKNLFDPGQLSLSVTSSFNPISVDTSLDSVSTPNSAPEKTIRRLAESLRGIASPELCGNKDFYGIGMKKSS